MLPMKKPMLAAICLDVAGRGASGIGTTLVLKAMSPVRLLLQNRKMISMKKMKAKKFLKYSLSGLKSFPSLSTTFNLHIFFPILCPLIRSLHKNRAMTIAILS